MFTKECDLLHLVLGIVLPLKDLHLHTVLSLNLTPNSLGVGGPTCSACLAGHWGMSPSGCTKCRPCSNPGHVCDPDTGTIIYLSGPILTHVRCNQTSTKIMKMIRNCYCTKTRCQEILILIYF